MSEQTWGWIQWLEFVDKIRAAGLRDDILALLKAAVMEEREACARLAERLHDPSVIVSAIRGRP